MNEYSKRIDALRGYMKEEGIDLYFFPMDDCHLSEYVAEHFRCIQYMTGFTGSAADVVVTAEGAWLYADGRYYVQAARQLEGSGIELMKLAYPGVPNPDDFIASKIKELAEGKEQVVLGFDGNVVSLKRAQAFENKSKKALGKDKDKLVIKCSKDLVDKVWTDRPAQVHTPIWNFDVKYCGETTASKINRIRAKVVEETGLEDGYRLLVSSLDDLVWIFNVRGNDVANNPILFSYAEITPSEAVFYTDLEAAKDVKEELEKQGVKLAPYSYTALMHENGGDAVVFDFSRTVYAIYEYYKNAGNEIINIKNPSELMKGIKNETELTCAKATLLRDCAVIVKFMKMLKEQAAKAGDGNVIKNVDGTDMTELSVDEWLTDLRAQDPNYFGLSFATIAAYKDNAAMMHYQAKPNSFSTLKAESMLLVDSGVQNYDGTTDITRTFILGPITEEEKKAFTLTAVSMLRLLYAKFISGVSGESLDVVARIPMWQAGLDYKCGTGHGVGHVLNVHEGPHIIDWKIHPDRISATLVPGMIVTDEPGVYREGKFGIRTENEILVVPYMNTDDGEFYQFESMTFIPVDLDGIDKKYMNDEDICMLNTYHKEVYEKLAPMLDEETKEFLKKYTAEI